METTISTSKSGKPDVSSTRDQPIRRTGLSVTRLSPVLENGVPVVTFSMIVEHHGQAWASRWLAVAGANTCIIMASGEAGIYEDDYLRFANVVDYGTATYFD